MNRIVRTESGNWHTGTVLPNRSFDADAQQRSFASLRSFPPVAGQLQRCTAWK
jgi:hypothetical protein